VRETCLGVYGENSTQWAPWFRSVAGLRFDDFHFDVAGSIEANSGKKSASLTSRRLRPDLRAVKQDRMNTLSTTATAIAATTRAASPRP
jgi:outer membrane receptor protein involved in Fe transport